MDKNRFSEICAIVDAKGRPICSITNRPDWGKVLQFSDPLLLGDQPFEDQENSINVDDWTLYKSDLYNNGSIVYLLLKVDEIGGVFEVKNGKLVGSHFSNARTPKDFLRPIWFAGEPFMFVKGGKTYFRVYRSTYLWDGNVIKRIASLSLP